MALVPIDTLPDDSRVWVFTADRQLDSVVSAALATQLQEFLASWTSHRRELSAGFEIRYGRFILIAADESYREPSGCSIDTLVNGMRRIGDLIGIPLVDTRDVTWRSDACVESADRSGFEDLVAQGQVTLDTVVFDRTVASLGDVRNGNWEKPARQSWHARAFTFDSPR